jgi:hypothetical protein
VQHEQSSVMGQRVGGRAVRRSVGVSKAAARYGQSRRNDRQCGHGEKDRNRATRPRIMHPARSFARLSMERGGQPRKNGGVAARRSSAAEVRLHYSHAALYETMRLFLPVQFDSKFCARPNVLPDGTKIVYDMKRYMFPCYLTSHNNHTHQSSLSE